MYSAKDFINSNISAKNLSIGWKLSVNTKRKMIVLSYTILNFDWESLKCLDCNDMNSFLSSRSYAVMKNKLTRCSKKFSRTYYDAYSVEMLKILIENENLKLNIDKMLSKEIKKRSEKIKHLTSKNESDTIKA